MAKNNKVTISTHNGDEVAWKHNYDKEFRDKEDHVDKERDIEILEYHDPREMYEELFGKAVEDFNKMQEDRHHDNLKIRNYFDKVVSDYEATKDKIRHKATPPIREMIVGMYPEEDDKTHEKKFEISAEEQTEMLKEFYKKFKKDNPNMHIVGAVIHRDEDSVHMHIDYIPVGHSDKGLKTKVNMHEAVKEEGFGDELTKNGKPNWSKALEKWTAKQNQNLEDIGTEHGFDVQHPQRGKHKKHLSKEDYEEAQDKAHEIIDEANKEADEIRQQAEEDARQIRSEAREDILEERQETRSERAYLVQKEQEAEQKTEEAERMKTGYQLAKHDYEKKSRKTAERHKKYDKIIDDFSKEIDEIDDPGVQEALTKYMMKKQKEEAELEDEEYEEEQETQALFDSLPFDIPGEQKQEEDEPTL